MTKRFAAVASVDRTIAVGALVLAALGPLVFDTFWVSFILTQVFWYALAAMSLIFLSAYGNMTSLAQVSIYGIAGFVLGNCVTTGETKGLNLGLGPWTGVVLAVAIATAVSFILGAVAARSTGIYFLMLTLSFAVMVNYFFGQVTLVSGFGGIGNVSNHLPKLLGRPDLHPNRLYYASLLVALAGYALLRYLLRTPFGLVLQGIRDDPVRMASLGYNVPLHRMLAFGLAGFICSFSGVIFVWWNNQISPGSIDITAVLNLLVIAVIGGLYRLEGAWIGAFVFVVVSDYAQSIGFLRGVGLTQDRFETLIGLVFLAIVILSPNGLLGIWEWIRTAATRLVRQKRRPRTTEPPEASPA
ncbi:MAG TPA: branched-chain amino acid ABC transporter permease [Gaiellaceae bacterium]|nr:branched-chain amino acid ABC transporter permease [Gaiellaceae bacterium]